MNRPLKGLKQKSVILFDLHQDLLHPLIFKDLNPDEFFKFNVVSIFTLSPWRDEFVEKSDVAKVLRTIETYREFAEKNGILIIEKAKDLKKVLNSKKKGFILEIEGCASIRDKYILKSFKLMMKSSFIRKKILKNPNFEIKLKNDKKIYKVS